MKVKYNLPESYSIAYYRNTIHILNFQLILSTQLNDKQCRDWENSLREKLKGDIDLTKINLIKESLLESPFFMEEEFKISSLSSFIIGYTANTENYLKELIELCLKRNTGLRKKAFSKIEFSALKLEEDISVNQIRKELFLTISTEKSQGKLFSEKFKRLCTFLEIDKSILSNKTLNSLDSIWKLRNKIAHSKSAKMDSYDLDLLGKKIQILKTSYDNEYFDFVTDLLLFVKNLIPSLEELDHKATDKWQADDFVQ